MAEPGAPLAAVARLLGSAGDCQSHQNEQWSPHGAPISKEGRQARKAVVAERPRLSRGLPPPPSWRRARLISMAPCNSLECIAGLVSC